MMLFVTFDHPSVPVSKFFSVENFFGFLKENISLGCFEGVALSRIDSWRSETNCLEKNPF